MVEEWRIKRYYRPRVLVETAAVLEGDYPAVLLCLDAGELAMLRKMTAYLHRRSSFVSEYDEQHYLAPTNAEWDELQAIVSALEGKLMGCEELETMLQEMRDFLECICRGVGRPYASPLVGEMYQYYIENNYIQWDNPYPEHTEEVDPTRCAIAQLTWQMSYEILTEIVQPAQNAAQDALFPVAYAALVTMMGSPIALLPAGALYLVFNAFIDAWVEGQLENVANTLLSYKDDLICAIYIALDGGDYRAAETACRIVIEGMTGISAVDKILFRALFAPWAMGAVAKAWANASTWATSNVVPGYCSVCSEIPLPLGYSLVPCIVDDHERDDFPWLTWTITGIGTHVIENEVVYSEPYIIGLDCDYQFARPAGVVGWFAENVMTGDYHQGPIWYSTVSGKYGNMLGGRLFWSHAAQGDNNKVLVEFDPPTIPQEVKDALAPDFEWAYLDLGKVTTENTMHGYDGGGEKTSNWTNTLWWVIAPE